MYPPIAKAAHITGKVVVRVTIKDGLVVKTDVLSKPDVRSGQRFLESPTVENLKTWRFAADVTTYVYDARGNLAAEYSTQPPSTPCLTCYLTTDHLGSTRLVTDENANVAARHDFLPFGEELVTSNRTSSLDYGVTDNVMHKYTGQERDLEGPGLDFFHARYFHGAQGRFTSPDKVLVGENPNNPQSWNLYSYGVNDPLRFIDPSGNDPGSPWDKPDDEPCGVHLKDCGPQIGPLPLTTGAGQTRDRFIGAAKGFASGLLDIMEFLGAPSGNIDRIRDSLHLYPASQNQEFGLEVVGFLAIMLPSGDAGELAKGARTWQEAGISAADALRIQNAADKTGQTIILIGSRAAGTAGEASDWDYVLSGASSARHAAASSLPTGTAGGEIRELSQSGIDIFQNYNSSAPRFTNVNPDQPHVIFTPKN